MYISTSMYSRESHSPAVACLLKKKKTKYCIKCIINNGTTIQMNFLINNMHFTFEQTSNNNLHTMYSIYTSCLATRISNSNCTFCKKAEKGDTLVTKYKKWFTWSTIFGNWKLPSRHLALGQQYFVICFDQ